MRRRKWLTAQLQMALDRRCRPTYTRAIVNQSVAQIVPSPHAGASDAPPTRRVLVIGDEPAAALSWARALAAEGLAVHSRGWDAAADPADVPDAWVLHVSRSLPEQLARLRALDHRVPRAPLLAVCQALRDLDQVLALEMGADDVVDNMLPAAVVAARLRRLWRRQTVPADAVTAMPEELRFGALALRRRERRATLRDKAVALTDSEFELLWLLALQAGRVVPRRQLVAQLRGLDYERHDRSIDCRVYRIRRKLGDDDPACQRVRTVRNRGYLFAPSPW